MCTDPEYSSISEITCSLCALFVAPVYLFVLPVGGAAIPPRNAPRQLQDVVAACDGAHQVTCRSHDPGGILGCLWETPRYGG